MIIFISTTFFQKMDIKLYSEFTIDKPSYVSDTDYKNLNKIVSIPVSVNENYLGKPLDIYILNIIIL